MTRPCSCDRTTTCRLCWLWHNDARYNRLWGGDGAVNARPAPWGGGKPAAAVVRVPPRPPCVHRGQPTGETRQCKACNKTVDVPLLSCGVYAVCTEARLVVGVECCRICKDYSPTEQS